MRLTYEAACSDMVFTPEIGPNNLWDIAPVAARQSVHQSSDRCRQCETSDIARHVPQTTRRFWSPGLSDAGSYAPSSTESACSMIAEVPNRSPRKRAPRVRRQSGNEAGSVERENTSWESLPDSCAPVSCVARTRTAIPECRWRQPGERDGGQLVSGRGRSLRSPLGLAVTREGNLHQRGAAHE